MEKPSTSRQLNSEVNRYPDSDSDSEDSDLDNYSEIGSHYGDQSDADIFEEKTRYSEGSYCKRHSKKKRIIPTANEQSQKKRPPWGENSIIEEWKQFSPLTDSQNNAGNISRNLSQYTKMESDDSLPDVCEESNYKESKSGWLTTRKRSSPISKGTQKATTVTIGKELTEEQNRAKVKKSSEKTGNQLSQYSQMDSDDSLPDVSEESNHKEPRRGWLTTRKRPSPTPKETQKATITTVLTEEQKRANVKKSPEMTSSALNECIEIDSDSDSIADIFDESSYKKSDVKRGTKRKRTSPRFKGKRQKKAAVRKKPIRVGKKSATHGQKKAVSKIKSQKNSEKTKKEISGKQLQTIKKIPFRKNVKGETPLHTACIRGKVERVKDLINSGHPVNAQDHVGWTPLHEAAIKGHKDVVDYLLDHGADIDNPGDAGITPLIDAASNGHVKVMQLLIERGANKLSKDDKGHTALDTLVAWQKNKSCSDTEFLSIYKDVVKRLGKTASQTDFRTKQSNLAQLPGTSLPSYMRTISDTDVEHSRDDYADSVTASDDESETRLKIITGDRLPGANSDSENVVLIVPSKRIVSHRELAAVHRELDINSEQSVVWPPLDKLESLTDEHLPHIILDIVMCIREDNIDSLTAILSNVKVEKYDYALMHSQGRFQSFFFGIVDDLAEVNKQRGRKVAWLMSRGNMKVLILYLSDRFLAHKNVLVSVRKSLYTWDTFTSLRDVSKKPTRTKEEFDGIWSWLMNKIRTSYKIDIYPDRQSHSAMEKILFSDEFSSMVTVELIKKLSYLQERLHDANDCSVAVVAIDGADRNVLKYQTFVRKTIATVTLDSSCKEIFYILSVGESDGLYAVSDILPPQLVGSANVYTAFDPKKVRPSCIIIHTKLEKMKRPSTSDSRGKKTISFSSSLSPVGSRPTSKSLR